MDYIVILIPVGIIILNLVYVLVKQGKNGTGRKVTIQLLDDESGNVCCSGSGNSYGSAAVDICRKLYNNASISKISSIQERIDSINKVINEYRGRMKEDDLKRCESYRDRLVNRIHGLEQEEKNRKREAEAEKQKRIEKEKAMSARKRYIAEQRRLMTDSLRYDVLHRDGFRCVLCGASPKNDPNIVLHVDHIVPLAKGGKTEMANLRTLCERCNMGKRDKIETGTVPVQQKPLQNVSATKKKEVSVGNVKTSKGTSKSEMSVVQILKEKGCSYIDKRDVGGNLWVLGGHELDGFMVELEKKGYKFHFRQQGGKSTKGEPAWFLSH